MKTIVLTRSILSCCFLLIAGGALHGHVFTNPDGKTVEGEIVNANDKTITIERTSDKKSFTIARARLSEADQAHATQWISDNPNVRLSIKTVKKSKDIEAPAVNVATTPGECYEIEIRNESAQASPELTLRYMLRQTKRVSTGTGNSSITTAGEVDVIRIPSIPAFRSTVISSRTVESVKTSHVSTETTRLADGRTRVDLDSSKSKSGLSGISLVIFHKNTKVAQHALMGMEKQTEQLMKQGNPSGATP